MLRSKIYLILCLMQMLLLPAMAERSSRLFEVFNASNGLADNSAQVIKCTRTGRIVTATMGQINFFDGQSFTFIDATEENVYPLENYCGNVSPPVAEEQADGDLCEPDNGEVCDLCQGRVPEVRFREDC